MISFYSTRCPAWRIFHLPNRLTQRWRNWQTRTFEGRVEQSVGVQGPPAAEKKLPTNTTPAIPTLYVCTGDWNRKAPARRAEPQGRGERRLPSPPLGVKGRLSLVSLHRTHASSRFPSLRGPRSGPKQSLVPWRLLRRPAGASQGQTPFGDLQDSGLQFRDTLFYDSRGSLRSPICRRPPRRAMMDSWTTPCAS